MLDCDIGLVGLAGSGKDTAAKALTDRGWRRIAFADRLKEIAYELGWDGLKDERGRKFLQDIGSVARAYDKQFWIDEATQVLNYVSTAFRKVPRVWTDVRFENEAQFIRDRGGIIIRVIRPDLVSHDTHESEVEQHSISADYTVVNAGTIEDLHAMIRNIIQ